MGAPSWRLLRADPFPFFRSQGCQHCPAATPQGDEGRLLPACAAVMRAVFPSLSCQLTSTWGHSARATTVSTKPW